MIRCPSYDAHKLFEGPEPSALEEEILTLLEAAGIPSDINDKIMKLVAEGEALAYEQGEIVGK